MTFGEMVGAVRRFWMVVAVFIAVSVVIAGVAATVPETEYEARATLLAQPDTERVDFAAVEAVRFLLPSLAELVGTNTFRGEVGQQLEPPAPASDVEVEAQFEPGTGIVHVTATDADPARAQRIAQLAAVLLGEQQLSTSVQVLVLDPPELPTAPAGPGTVTFLAGGLILGLLGGVLLAIVLAAADRAREEVPPEVVGSHQDTINGAAPVGAAEPFGAEPDAERAVETRYEPVEESTNGPASAVADAAAAVPAATIAPASLQAEVEQLGLDILAVVPVKGRTAGAAANGTGDFDGAFRLVGRRLGERAQMYRRVLVTSPRTAAGRTTVTANTAWALATSGASVLAVDGDLENPTLHRFLRVSNEHGLSELGTSKLSEVVQTSSVPTLAVVAAGKPPDAGTTALEDAIRRLLAETAASVVLVDGPALLESSAAIGACRTTGAVILVLDATDPRSSVDARTCVQDLQGRGVDILGVVVNKASGRQG